MLKKELFLKKLFRSFIGTISEKLYASLLYKKSTREWISWDHPKTLSEKILWLSLNHPEVSVIKSESRLPSS